jgi:ATP-dependent RNA helicase RhlE
LDISDLSCVVNYDLPLDSETYVHRIWRTARAWKDGLAISFCTNQDKEKLTKVEELIGQKLEVVKDDSYKDVIVPRWQSEKTKKINEKKRPRSKKKRHYWK